jgi:hypothetical protein
MIIEGKVLHVMESWPLQLIVEGHEGNIQVALELDTKVTRHSHKVNPKEIVPGINIRADGDSSTGNKFGMTAKSIEIID